MSGQSEISMYKYEYINTIFKSHYKKDQPLGQFFKNTCGGVCLINIFSTLAQHCCVVSLLLNLTVNTFEINQPAKEIKLFALYASVQ